jgi:hypothetical protein
MVAGNPKNYVVGPDFRTDIIVPFLPMKLQKGTFLHPIDNTPVGE